MISLPINSINLSKPMNKEKERSPYETLLALCIVLLIAYVVFDISWAAKASLVLGLVGLLSKTIAGYVHRFWMSFTHILGTLMTHLLLFLVFYLFLVPIAFLYRLAGKAGMKKSLGKESNYVERNHTFTAKDLENLW